MDRVRSYIEVMGGQLEIIARFLGQAVRIMQFETLDPNEDTQK